MHLLKFNKLMTMIFLLLLVGGSSQAGLRGECQMTAKCELGTATCSADTEVFPGTMESRSGKCEKAKTFLKCTSLKQNLPPSSVFICCDHNGGSLVLYDEFEAKKYCAGF